MRIKLFENFDEKLYQEVESFERDTPHEFFEKMVVISTSNANLILNSIDRREFELLRLPVMDFKKFNKSKDKPEFFQYSYLIIRPQDKLVWDDDYIKLEIYEDFDEWFWVKMETAGEDLFFKCDTMDGLIQFLKEYKVIKQ
jgi:hypothetical protein